MRVAILRLGLFVCVCVCAWTVSSPGLKASNPARSSSAQKLVGPTWESRSLLCSRVKKLELHGRMTPGPRLWAAQGDVSQAVDDGGCTPHFVFGSATFNWELCFFWGGGACWSRPRARNTHMCCFSFINSTIWDFFKRNSSALIKLVVCFKTIVSVLQGFFYAHRISWLFSGTSNIARHIE